MIVPRAEVLHAYGTHCLAAGLWLSLFVIYGHLPTHREIISLFFHFPHIARILLESHDLRQESPILSTQWRSQLVLICLPLDIAGAVWWAVACSFSSAGADSGLQILHGLLLLILFVTAEIAYFPGQERQVIAVGN